MYEDIYKKIIDLFPDITDYNHKSLDDDGETLKINAKIMSSEKNPVVHIYKILDEIHNLQSVSVKEIFD